MGRGGRRSIGRAVTGAVLLVAVAALLALPMIPTGAPEPLPLSPRAAPTGPNARAATCSVPNCATAPLPARLAQPAWYNVSAAQRFTPPPLVGASMAYDSLDNYLLLFGGCSPIACPGPAQTWAYSGGAWTNLTGLGLEPPARSMASLVYDAADGYLVLFGGRGSRGIALNDTWSYDGGVWTNLTNTTSAPPARFAASMIYDSVEDFVVVYGGCGPTMCPRNDTWRFINGGWRNLSKPAGSPPPARYGASFSGDAGDAYGVLFGGNGTTGLLNDTWGWQKGKWVDLNLTVGPSVRAFASMTYDIAENQTYLFGGNGSSGLLGDVWRYSAGHWTNITALSGAGPSPRLGMATPETSITVTLAGAKRWAYSFFYGGENGTCLTCGNRSLNDSWIFEVGLSVSAGGLPTVVEVGQPVDFTATVTGGSTPYQYLWEFGDGASVFAAGPVHAYGWAHAFTAQLSLSDSSGAEVDATVLVTVVTGPTVSATIRPNATDVGRAVSFVGLAAGGTSPYAFRWSFGDQAGAAIADAAHNYTSPGRFMANLSVTDTVQGTGVAFGNVTINALPQITASASNLSPMVGTNVSFSASVAGGTGPFAFAWDLGDGNSSAAAMVAHDFTVARTYSVSASVVDAVGAVSWENFSVVVSGPPPPPPPSHGSKGLTTEQLLGGALVAVGIVLAVVVAVLLLLHRRRREPPSLAAAAVGRAGWDDEEADSPAASRTARRNLERFYRRRT